MSGRRALLPLLLILVALGVIAPAASGKRPRSCGAGVTLFVEGKLRIFGVPYRTSLEQGYEEWACLGGRGPQSAGLEGFDGGAGSWDTPAYAFAGGRYLGSYSWTDGEGGPSASFEVDDLKTERRVSWTGATYEDGVPPFRVAENGALLFTDEDEIDLLAPGARRARTLSSSSAPAGDLALAGGTVYWTEHPKGAPAEAHSATLPGIAGDTEGRMLEPIHARPNGRGCRAARGRTLASSPAVRVYRRAGSTVRRACRIGGGSLRIPARAPVPRIVNDRWLLVLGPGSPAAMARVVDMRTGRTVTTVAAGGPGIHRATMLGDGTLAWLEEGGRVLAQRPNGVPVELAPADPAPSALAASRTTVYWTAGGAPHAARPPR
jgi:hypothetical protein